MAYMMTDSEAQRSGDQLEDEDEASGSDESEEEVFYKEEGLSRSYDPEAPDEGIYGMAVASVIVDSRKIQIISEPVAKLRHVARMLLSLFILFFTLGLQLYITIETKWIVTPDAVREVRQGYSHYQAHMYNKTVLTVNGFHRGVPETFDIHRFETLSPDTQQNICNFSLSQPRFLFAILLLWVLTCVRYIRKNLNFSARLFVIPMDIKSMASKGVYKESEDGKNVVVKITWLVKAFVLVFVQMPCLVMNLVLLWIGCRWLVATLGFGEILLNAIALEFVLFLHEIIYHAAVPMSLRKQLERVVIPHAKGCAPNYPVELEGPSCCNMFGTFSCLIVAIIFTWCYINYFQQVLPEYRWDIATACEFHKELLE